jgi:hypothetical protein
LRIDTLPNLLFCLTIYHVSVFAELELRSNPFSVKRHAKAEVETILNRDQDHLRLITLVFFFTSLCSRLLSSFLVCLSLCLFSSFTLKNFLFGFETFL